MVYLPGLWMDDRIIVGLDGLYQLWDDLLPIGDLVRYLFGAYLQITTLGPLPLRSLSRK